MDDIEVIKRIISKADILKVRDIDKIAHIIYKEVYSKYDTDTIIDSIINNRELIGVAPYIYKILMKDSERAKDLEKYCIVVDNNGDTNFINNPKNVKLYARMSVFITKGPILDNLIDNRYKVSSKYFKFNNIKKSPVFRSCYLNTLDFTGYNFDGIRDVGRLFRNCSIESILIRRTSIKNLINMNFEDETELNKINNLYFEGCDIDSRIKIQLRNKITKFNKDRFMDSTIVDSHGGFLDITECDFERNVKMNIFYDNIVIDRCKFKGDTNIVIGSQNVDIKNCIFDNKVSLFNNYKTEVTGCIFNGGIDLKQDWMERILGWDFNIKNERGVIQVRRG